MAKTIQSNASMRRALLEKLTEGKKDRVVSRPVLHRNDDVTKYLNMLDKFERESARTRHRVG